jgi:hypothetical protein
MKKLAALSLAARNRGVSLIEGVLYLVIALAVIVGGIVFFQQAQLSNQVTDTARAGVGISSQTRGLFMNQRSFGTAEVTDALINAGAVPSNFQNAAGDAIVHPFGGEVEVHGNGAGFAMTMLNLSEEACLRLATVGDGGDGPMGTGITGVTVAADNTGLDFTAGTVAPASAAPVSAATLSTDTACGAADPDVTVFYSR